MSSRLRACIPALLSLQRHRHESYLWHHSESHLPCQLRSYVSAEQQTYEFLIIRLSLKLHLQI